MRKIYNKLSVILIMLLSLVIIASTALLVVTNVSADTAVPQATEQSEEQTWYTIKVGENNESLTILVKGTIGSYVGLSAGEFANFKSSLTLSKA